MLFSNTATFLLRALLHLRDSDVILFSFFAAGFGWLLLLVPPVTRQQQLNVGGLGERSLPVLCKPLLILFIFYNNVAILR